MKLRFSVTIFQSILLSALTLQSSAQTNKDLSTADSLFSGVWKGSSICQIKNSPCHDENVVFYISKANKNNVVEVNGNKIVNGEEVEMGKIQFQYDPETKQITSISQPNAIWKFERKQNVIAGTLYSNKALYKIINLTKQ